MSLEESVFFVENDCYFLNGGALVIVFDLWIFFELEDIPVLAIFCAFSNDCFLPFFKQ